MGKVFFCTKCHKTFRIDGNKTTCSCGGNLILTDVSIDNWRNMTDDERTAQKAVWIEEYDDGNPTSAIRTNESEDYSDDKAQRIKSIYSDDITASRMEKAEYCPAYNNSEAKDGIISLLEEQNEHLKKISSDMHIISLWFVIMIVILILSVIANVVTQLIPLEIM